MFNMKKVTFTIVNIYLISHVLRASVGLQLSQPLWRNIDALWRPFFSGNRGEGDRAVDAFKWTRETDIDPHDAF